MHLAWVTKGWREREKRSQTSLIGPYPLAELKETAQVMVRWLGHCECAVTYMYTVHVCITVYIYIHVLYIVYFMYNLKQG